MWKTPGIAHAHTVLAWDRSLSPPHLPLRLKHVCSPWPTLTAPSVRPQTPELKEESEAAVSSKGGRKVWVAPALQSSPVSIHLHLPDWAALCSNWKMKKLNFCWMILRKFVLFFLFYLWRILSISEMSSQIYACLNNCNNFFIYLKQIKPWFYLNWWMFHDHHVLH